MHSADDLAMCLGDFNGQVRRHINGFDRVHGGYDVGQMNLKEQSYFSFVRRRNYACQKRKVTFRMGENETKNDFVMT